MSHFHHQTALVHDWLPVYAGAERVLEQMIRLAPRSEVYTLVDFIDETERGFLGGRPVHTSFIQNLPFAQRLYRHYLPLCPLAIEGFDLSDYDTVVSSSYVVAKGVLTTADQLHISYVHSPVRYAWDLHFEYLREGGYDRGLKRAVARLVMHYLRLYDAATATRPDLLVANSHYVARRIWKTYRRHAAVVHPPVDVESFTLQREKENYYVTVCRLVPYKRVELLVEAFGQMSERELVVIGSGPELERLRDMAPSNVHLLGHVPQETLRQRLQGARAFVYAATEDFGIAPVEAQACGTPVIAYGRGGVLETVSENETGLFFDEQNPEAVREAVERFEAARFDPESIRQHAESFSVERFRKRFASLLHEARDQFQEKGAVAPPTGPPGHAGEELAPREAIERPPGVKS